MNGLKAWRAMTATAVLMLASAPASAQRVSLEEAFSESRRMVEARLEKAKAVVENDPYRCRSRESYLERAIRSGSLPAEEVLPKAAGSGSQVIILAEDHWERPNRHFSRLFEGLNRFDGGFDCLALEKDSSCQPLVEEILSGKTGFEEASRAAEGRCRFYEDEEVLFAASKRIGARVFAIDDLSRGHDGQGRLAASVLADFPHRNAQMSRRTAALLRDGQCRKVLSVVGASHAVRKFEVLSEGDSWDPLPAMLDAAGVRVAVVGVMSRASYREKYGDAFAPKECGWNLWKSLPEGRAPFGFLPRRPSEPADFAQDPENGRLVVSRPIPWDSYSAVLVIP